jgi:hypothetical protein
MKYNQPYGAPGANDPYINGNPSTGTMGSIPPAASIEYPQREIVEVIAAGGLTPDNADLTQLAKAIQGGKIIFGGTSANAGNAFSASVSPVPNALTVGMCVVVKMNAAPTGPATFALNTFSFANVIRRGGAAIGKDEWAANDFVAFWWTGSQWQTGAGASPQSGGLILALMSLDLYVATSGNDTTGDGTASKPFLTIQKAYNFAQQTYNLNGHTLTIHVADGTYLGSLQAAGPITGTTGPGGVQIIGNTTTPANCYVITSGNVPCFYGSGGAQFYVDGFRIGIGGATTIIGCIWATGNGTAISVGTHIHYAGAVNSANIKSDVSGTVIMRGCVIENASFGYHLYASAGQIYSAGVSDTIICQGTPAFGGACASVTYGYIGTLLLSVSGFAVGKKYEANNLAWLNTYGSGANYFPGDSAGTIGTYGIYS